MLNHLPHISVLIVARWPLGGIRTYMLYMFSRFSSSFRLTILAASTLEDPALLKDCDSYKAELKLVQTKTTLNFALQIFKELKASRYDVILSQGFISSVAVYLANMLFRIPHVLVIHGIVEPQYLSGSLGKLKRWILGWVISRFTVLYAVSNDILEHLYSQFPRLKINGPQAIVIPNGIDLEVLAQVPANPLALSEILDITPGTFLFGFLGRFMPQKGFDLLIEAVDILNRQDSGRSFAVVAVGSGDYLREYQAEIQKRGLEGSFHFLPFQPMVHHLYSQLDVVLIPSRWEACPLLPMEALCMGVPLITSDCIGLRETVADSPAHVFPSENVGALTGMMLDSMCGNRVEDFGRFVPAARTRYDINFSSERLMKYIENLLNRE